MSLWNLHSLPLQKQTNLIMWIYTATLQTTLIIIPLVYCQCTTDNHWAYHWLPLVYCPCTTDNHWAYHWLPLVYCPCTTDNHWAYHWLPLVYCPCTTDHHWAYTTEYINGPLSIYTLTIYYWSIVYTYCNITKKH